MTRVADWVEGARPRTFPAAFSPVLAGCAMAWFAGRFSAGMGVLALIVSLALQIGVNFANDYSDGIRGTDADRVGPMRLVGSGAAPAAAVKLAAFGCFAVAGIAGLGLCLWSGLWWLLLVGIACVLAAWFYTGGRNPYGYRGLGEIFVFIFFGLVAVCGTTGVMTHRIDAATVCAACAIGFLACAILVANNLRDIDGDRLAGKHTLATRLGDRGTRWFFVVLGIAAVAAIVATAALSTWWALLGCLFVVPLAGPTRLVVGGAKGPALIAVLKATGIAELVCSLGLVAGMVLSTTLG